VPVRFQVDPDFYDHPKVLGMSDAAVSLWTRAGSYSVAKSTDGFVAETVLVHALRSTLEVADELVHRGLWQRRKGGFQFHEWDARNLTKARIEADREADRERKRLEREAARQNGKKQVNKQVVRPDTERTPEGTQTESEGNPPSSVSLSVSVSESSPPKPPKGARRRRYDYGDDERFKRFWAAFPLKEGKAAAYQAWLKALERGVNPEWIISAAQRYRDDPRRNPDMTKHPQGWLNDERYGDEQEVPEPVAARGWWDN
jgi:hypothetical protein